jgi:hypothetical protein
MMDISGREQPRDPINEPQRLGFPEGKKAMCDDTKIPVQDVPRVVADELGVPAPSLQAVWRWRRFGHRGRTLPAVRCGHRVFVRFGDLKKFLLVEEPALVPRRTCEEVANA